MSPLAFHPGALEIERPTFVVDRLRVERNIDRMVRKAAAAGVRLRPHFKTHQSAVIGEWFRGHGIESITVSSLGMARYFAAHGWSDITVAFPANLREMATIDDLARRIDLGVLVDTVEVAETLGTAMNAGLRVWIKIDVGYGRAGVAWRDTDAIVAIARAIAAAPHLGFAGLLTHSGHSYAVRGVAELERIHDEAVTRLGELSRALLAAGAVETCAISIGDTPTCSVVDDLSGVDEIRPGNFVFYDLMQQRIGSCSDGDIAVAVACPVTGKYPARGEIVLYCGAVHLAKEALCDAGGHGFFGYLMEAGAERLGAVRRDAPLVSLSQEHGIVRLEPRELEDIEIGDLVLVAPVHSCLTADMYAELKTLDGESLPRLH